MRIRVATAGVVLLLLSVASCADLSASAGTASGSPSRSVAAATAPSSRPDASDRSAAEPAQNSQDELPALTGDWERLGHEGFLELRLGMSEETAVKTGRIRLGETVGRCTGFYLAMYGDSLPGPDGYFTRGRGLSVIRARGGMHTPEGITLGSPLSALAESYAHLVGSPDFVTATLSDDSAYFFIGERSTVASFGLSQPGDPCMTQWLDRGA